MPIGVINLICLSLLYANTHTYIHNVDLGIGLLEGSENQFILNINNPHHFLLHKNVLLHSVMLFACNCI